MIITLKNVRDYFKKNGIVRQRVYGHNNVNKYRLLKTVNVKLSDGNIIVIPEGYEWDLASVPRLLWGIVPPDSDAELAFLIHDYLYENQINSRKWADAEMLQWSIVTNGTQKWSIRNVDNYIRYWAVRLGGQKAWRSCSIKSYSLKQ